MNNDEAGGEEATTTEAVGQGAGGEDGRGEGERVRVDDPLQAAEAASRSSAMRESAVLTTAMSSMSIAVAAQTTMRVQCRWVMRGGPSDRGA